MWQTCERVVISETEMAMKCERVVISETEMAMKCREKDRR